MNPRERVLASMNHQEPDRIPIDLGGIQSGIHIRAYKKLLKFLNIEDTNLRFVDIGQQLALPCEELLERFHIDVRYLYLEDSIVHPDVEFQISSDEKYKGFYDQFGVLWGVPVEKPRDEILYLDPVIHPLKDCKSVEEVNHLMEINTNNPNDKSIFRDLKLKSKNYRKNGNYTISTPPMGNTFEFTNFLFGFTKSLKLLRKQPEIIVAAMQRLLDYWKKYVNNFYTEIEGNVDIICVNGDLAEQAGPIMNPRVYKKYIQPLDRELSEFIHNLGDVKINYHSCGAVTEFIPSFIENGYDAINPVQLGAYEMEAKSLKTKFGDKITFWGGLCNTNTLAFGTPQSVELEVKQNLENFKLNGGFIAANIHNITAEVPPENITAMFDSAYKYCFYNR